MFMCTSLQIRLSTMMFLEFFIWGGWYVTMGSYLTSTLHASGAQTALAYSTQCLGGLVAPFLVGLVADRFINAEILLAVINLLGAVLLYFLAGSARLPQFYAVLLIYMMLYMPTLALVNSISFRQMSNRAGEFPRIRVWGTIGWIVAGIAISWVYSWDSPSAIHAGALRNTFRMSAVASVLLGLYSLTLPPTPPTDANRRSGLSQWLGFDALRMLRDRNYLVFFIASILISIPLAFYYQHANQFLTEIHVANATGKQTLGQASEIGFMLLMPYFLGRFGIKGTLLLGMLAWGIRYLLFAYGNAGDASWMLIVAIALHGVCYDFFFVSGQIFTAAKADKQHETAAQGLITLATYGAGMMIGFWIAGHITDHYVTQYGHEWRDIWVVPSFFAFAISVFYFLTFRNERLTLTNA